MDLFVSNRLESLANTLKEHLFQSGGDPLTKRWVVVPSKQIEQALLLRWAQDEELQIAAGVKIITWSEALGHLFPDIPSASELSLRIETVIGDIDEVATYLREGGIERKITLCDTLATLFLQYLAEPKIVVQGWQKTVWEKVFGTEMPWKRHRLFQGKIYLFHCWQIAPYQLEAFKKMSAVCFLFSPCALYWGDLQTFREQRHLLNKAHESEKEGLFDYFKNDHPFLSNWGKKGRELLELFESEEGVEVFEEPQGDALLQVVQKEMLALTTIEKSVDRSIEIHSAPSKLREVELVWELIQQQPYQPSEILVLAPDISSYAPVIELVFQNREGPFDYAIFGLEAETKSAVIHGFKDLLALVQRRFSKESVEKLLLSPPFLARFKFSQEEAHRLKEWFDRSGIRYDLKEDHATSWQSGLTRLVEALVRGSETVAIDFSEADLLSRWIEVVDLFHQELSVLEKELSLKEWAQSLKHLISTFFVTQDDFLLREIDRLMHFQVEGVFGFTSIHRLLVSIFSQKVGAIQSSHLQAVKFSSLDKGALMPAKVVILMGMEEGNFPRQDAPSSLNLIAKPRRLDNDRYLFLEALSHARKALILTYTRIDAEDGKEQLPSPLIGELKRYTGVKVTDHPFETACKVSKIGGNSMIELPEKRFEMVDIKQLKSLARHPLRYFFENRLGIDFEYENKSSEFGVSPLDLFRIRNEALVKPLSTILERFEQEGKLPVGVFAEVAKKKIVEEVESYREMVKKFGIDPHEIYSIELRTNCLAPLEIEANRWVYPALEIDGVVVQGTIDGLCPKGLLFHGDDTFADKLKVWPLYLVVKTLGLPSDLLLTKKGKTGEINGSKAALHRYLQYGKKALSSPSPFIPRWAKRVIDDMTIPEDDDPIFTWAQKRGLLPERKLWATAWQPYLKELVDELF